MAQRPGRSLPPMTSLPVFDAVGRHMSIVKAANELCLTAGAVSRQIQNLEAFLGCELVERVHRRIAFTPAGEVYWTKIHASLDTIRGVTSDLAVGIERRPLVIGSPRVFLQKCIMPALGTLYARNPDIVVKFVTGAQDIDSVDGTIHVGEAIDRKGVLCEILGDADLTPVCSPSYLRRAPKLETPMISSIIRFCARPNSPATGNAGSASARQGSSPMRASSTWRVPVSSRRPPSKGWALPLSAKGW